MSQPPTEGSWHAADDPDGSHHDPHYDDPHFDDPHFDDPHVHDPEHHEGEYLSEGDSLADDVLYGESAEHDESPMFRHRRQKKRSPLLRWAAILLALAVVVGGGYVGVRALSGSMPSFDFGGSAPEDFEGAGSGEVLVVVPPGAGGNQIGILLEDAGVVASVEAFTAAYSANSQATSIQPGTYTLASEMSGVAAVDRLLDPAARESTAVTIREGLWQDEVFAVLSERTDTPLQDYEEVDPADLPLPDAAEGEMEGFLFPDTYDFSPNATAQEQLATMVTMGKQRYAALGLEDGDELRRAVIVGSLVQAEGAASDDLPKVARVIENRLADDETLGFDSTIHFIHQERGRVGTTDSQRAEDDPYNTYLYPGLPPGPINSPGAAAIEAAMNPAEGTWKFFVTVNPSTGETVFTDTYEEHQVYVEEFLQWCSENPDQC